MFNTPLTLCSFKILQQVKRGKAPLRILLAKKIQEKHSKYCNFKKITTNKFCF